MASTSTPHRRRKSASGSSLAPATTTRLGPPHPLRVLLLVGVLAITAVAIGESQRHIRAHLQAAEARYLAERWVNNPQRPPSEARVQAALAAAQRALTITPDDPLLHEQVGDLHLLLAQLPDVAVLKSDIVKLNLQNAIAAYRAAIALRPRDGQTWAALATALHLQGADKPEVYKAWRQALALGPNEGHVMPMLLELVLRDWAVAPKDLQDWATSLFERSSEEQRARFNRQAERYGLHFEATPPE
jgi:tetratricopeptide (TPR) repeat protein